MAVKLEKNGGGVDRKAREEALRQTIILEAAEHIIAQKGYRGAAMEEIARAAELSTGSLYNAFGSKEDLYRALVANRSAQLVAHVQGHVTADTAQGRLENVLDTLFQYFDANRNFFLIYLDATSGFPWHIKGTMGSATFHQYQALVQAVADIFRDGIAAGEVARADPAHLAVAFMGGLNGFITHWISRQPDAPLLDLLPAAKAVLLRLK
ncbi:MAG: TetR/AcrR family transcriptional regulator [Myxococcota bacterium]